MNVAFLVETLNPGQNALSYIVNREQSEFASAFKHQIF